jgi:hypothetical protein
VDQAPVDPAPIGWVKFWKPKDDWYYLPADQRQAYLNAYEQVADVAQAGGARLVGAYACRGQSTWSRFEFWEFATLQAVIDFTHALEEIGHYQYFAESNTVGRRYEKRGRAESWVI